MKDIAIVGAGPAGYSAATARSRSSSPWPVTLDSATTAAGG